MMERFRSERPTWRPFRAIRSLRWEAVDVLGAFGGDRLRGGGKANANAALLPLSVLNASCRHHGENPSLPKNACGYLRQAGSKWNERSSQIAGE